MTSKLTLRPATAADAEAIAGLAARTFYETFADSNDPERMEAYLATEFTPARLAAEIADPSATFWVAMRDGRALGYAKLTAGEPPECVGGPRPVELERLYVARDHLGAGVGPALLETVVAEARRRGFATLWLGVWERNPRARRFYEKWGFREVGVKPFYFADEVQEDLVMVLALGELEARHA